MDQAWSRASEDCEGSPAAQATGGLHASLTIEGTQALFDHAVTQAPSFRIEVYGRAATRTRVTRASLTRSGDVESGAEDGIAVRVVAQDGCRGFASCSGASIAAVDWAVAAAARHASDPSAAKADWAEGARLVDRDETLTRPTVARLAAWLTAHPSCGWVECAQTVETWIATGGLTAERTRGRAWCATGSTVSASRSLDDLGASLELEEKLDESAPQGRRAQPIPVVVMPEAAAQLVGALVHTLHRDSSLRGARVGQGWNLHDDPGVQGSVLGGTFDDAGFPTCRTELADGRNVVGWIGSPGFLRRGSYRDRPSPHASSLVVTPTPVQVPSNSFWVRVLGIHALDSQDWILEARTNEKPTFFRVHPVQLVERCVGGVGAARQTSKGVRTPALVFDGLRPVD